MAITLDGSTGISVSGNNSLSIGTFTAGNTTITGTANISSTLGVTGALSTGNVSVTGTQFVNGVVTFANSTSNNFYFAANGNIGLLSNNTPVYSVDIAKNEDSSYTGVGIRNSNTGSSASARVVFFNDNTNAAVALTSSGVANAGYNRASALSIHTSSSSATGGISVAARTTGGYIDFYTSGNNQRLLIANTGDVMINTANNTAGGFANKLIVKQTSESWVGGIGVEAASNDHVLTIASDSTGHVIAASYRTLSGYRPITIKSGNVDALTIDTSGRVKKPYTPGFSAYSPAVTGQSSTIVWGSTRHNQGSHYNTSTGRFTAPIDGLYFFTFSCLMTTTADYVRLYFNYNGSHNATYGDTLQGGATTAWAGWSYASCAMSLAIYMYANEYMAVWNDGPNATYGTSYGSFSGFFVG